MIHNFYAPTYPSGLTIEGFFFIRHKGKADGCIVATSPLLSEKTSRACSGKMPFSGTVAPVLTRLFRRNYESIIVEDPHTRGRVSVQVDKRNLQQLIDIQKKQEEQRVLKLGLGLHQGLDSVAGRVYSLWQDAKFQDLDTIVLNAQSMIRYLGNWHKVERHAEGAHFRVQICSDIAVKVLKAPQDGVLHLQRSRGLAKILSKVHKKGRCIGIEPSPLMPLHAKESKKYAIQSDGTLSITRYDQFVQVEAAACDCLTAINNNHIDCAEISSITACLVEGSSVLLRNRVYFLDVKWENTGHPRRGIAYYADLMGSIDYSDPDWSSKSIVHKRSLRNTEEWQHMLEEKDSEKKEQALGRIHIRLVGDMLRKLDSKFPAAYTKEQNSCIDKMRSPVAEDRPSIEEVQKVFPTSLIRYP